MSEPESMEGARCVVAPGGLWELGTVRRVNEDGTFKVELDDKPMILLPCFYGVTLAEISFNDEARWPALFAEFTEGRGELAQADFDRILTTVGFQPGGEKLAPFWIAGTTALLGVSEDKAREGLVLDRDQSYQLLLHAGVSAKRLADCVAGGPLRDPYFKLYWNQLRMGGRDPAEVARPVGIDDALDAIGCGDGAVDTNARASLAAFESKNRVRLPEALRRLATAPEWDVRVRDSHPNNPVPYLPEYWVFERGLRTLDVDGNRRIVIMEPHQGDHLWVAVFDDGEEDARIYLKWPEDTGGSVWRKVAPTIGFFFWDLAQTGLGWWQDPRVKAKTKRVVRTEIGLARRR